VKLLTTLCTALLLTALLFIPAQGQQASNLIPATIACGTASTPVLEAGSYRYIALINISDTAIWISTAGTAAVGSGIPLRAATSLSVPDGGAVVFDVTVPRGPIACIHGGTGTKSLNIAYGP
jgi:hypothetical protein